MTQEQYDRVLVRLHRLENVVNDLITAQKHFITSLQMQQLNVVFQSALADLSERTVALESRVQSIEEEPIGG